MTTSQNYQMLSPRDPVWLGMGLALLIFAVLIVVEISLAPTYIDVQVEAEGYTFEWPQPERMTVQVEGEDGWPERYFVTSLSSEACLRNPESGLSLKAGLQTWVEANNWEIVNPSMEHSCQEYAGLDLVVNVHDAVTLKPLGWDEGQEWNATLCVTVLEGDPCGTLIVTAVVPSFGVMVSNR